MNTQPLRHSRTDRRATILEVAREIFLHEGYAAASMSSIAAQAGGSKGTLYNYFPSKESLFAALIEAECESELWITPNSDAEAADVESVLADIGGRFLNFVLTDKIQTLHRLVIAECERFPELGRAFYENGPRQGISILAGWMASEIEAARLAAGDPEAMAMVFLELCKAGLHQRRLWNIEPEPSEAAKAANVAEAVRIFMAAYGKAAARPDATR
jgi:AcrR family transcriptional regulator